MPLVGSGAEGAKPTFAAYRLKWKPHGSLDAMLGYLIHERGYAKRSKIHGEGEMKDAGYRSFIMARCSTLH